MKRTLIVAAGLIGLLAGTPQVSGAIEDDGVFRLGEVVVSAEKSGVEGTGTVDVITAEDIEISGARSLDEALNLVPGLHIRTGGDGTPRLDVRGMRTRGVILLVNGVPLNSTYDNQFDISFIPAENIAEIKVTRGASSVLYGPGGTAGVVNVITKQGSEGVHGSLGVEYGTNDAWLGRGTLSGGNDKLKMFASGSILSEDDYPLSSSFDDTDLESGTYRDNSDKERKSFNTTFMFTPEEATSFGLNLGIFSGEYGKPAAVLDDDYADPKYVRTESLEGRSAQLTAEHHFDSPLSLKGWVYVNEQDETEVTYKDDTFSDVKSTEDSTATRFGTTVQAGYDLTDLGGITLALAGERARWDATTVKSKSTEDIDKTTSQGSASLEYSVNPVDPLGITLGYSYATLSRTEADNVDGHSYYVGAYYDLTETTRLKANHARKLRFPSLKEMYKGDDQGDPELNPEIAYHYELGIEQEIPSVDTSLSLTGFRIDAKDYIEKIDDVYKNNDEYRFQGVELGVTNRSVTNLTLHASYSYLKSENKSDDQEMDELQYRPENKFTADITYLFPMEITGYVSYLFMAEQYELGDKDDDGVYDSKTRIDDIHVVNLKVSKSLFEKALEVYVGADNLFDADYEESYALPREGRTIYGGLTYRF